MKFLIQPKLHFLIGLIRLKHYFYFYLDFGATYGSSSWRVLVQDDMVGIDAYIFCYKIDVTSLM